MYSSVCKYFGISTENSEKKQKDLLQHRKFSKFQNNSVHFLLTHRKVFIFDLKKEGLIALIIKQILKNKKYIYPIPPIGGDKFPAPHKKYTSRHLLEYNI
eukprot:TRINITY_DN17838_c1_g1_i2.p5 TRINITY_DN17838_c1_g1~~TRINITY_DN17838_c1_g1_i2.p5  ORF type:complete len:100 (+),score=6.67 TRINITY_DN17838_c1_g1_i2:280-579(+)